MVHGVIQGAAEAWMVAEAIAEAEIGLLLGPIDVQPNNFEHLRARYDNAALLHQAGVRFAFRSGANHDARMLPTKAAIAVAHGLPFGEAIKALTINATDILGLDPLVGNIGEHNSFFICDGDPLLTSHHIHRMWIDGREVTSAHSSNRALLDQLSHLKMSSGLCWVKMVTQTLSSVKFKWKHPVK